MEKEGQEEALPVHNGEAQAERTIETAEGKAAQSAANKKKDKVKEIFSAKKIATMGVMTALSFVVSLLSFPIFPATSFLKLDFGNVFIMLTGFLFGPVEGIIVCVLKEALRIPLGTSGGIGELANMIITCSYLILPATVYRYKKGLKVVIVCLIAATFITTAVSLPVNRYINFPLFVHEAAGEYFAKLWYFVLLFNLIKAVIISVITCLLYKTLSKLLKKF